MKGDGMLVIYKHGSASMILVLNVLMIFISRFMQLWI
jgi:hypothetical protein